MSNFARSVKREFAFDGDTVHVTFTLMKATDFKSLSRFIKTDERGRPTSTISFTDQVEMLSLASEILPKRVTSMTGLKDLSGVEMAIEEIVDEQYFIPLISEIFGAVLEASNVRDPKKHGEPSGASLKDSPALTTVKEDSPSHSGGAHSSAVIQG